MPAFSSAKARRPNSTSMGRPKKAGHSPSEPPATQSTVQERRPGGRLTLHWWRPKDGDSPGQWVWRGLKHSDRELGHLSAREVSAQFLALTMAASSGKATGAEVLTAYERDVCVHQKGDGKESNVRDLDARARRQSPRRHNRLSGDR